MNDDAKIKRVMTANLYDLANLPTIEDAIEAFLRLEMASKSRQTANWYRRRLDALAVWLGESRPIGDVMESELTEYYAQLAERTTMYGTSRPVIHGGLSAYTLHGHVRAIRRWCRWMQQQSILTVDLSDRMQLPRLPRQGRKGISDSNMDAILAAAHEHVRDYALLMFLATTGVRRGGIASLRQADLNLDTKDERLRRRATVREKGQKERVVIMSRDALAALEAWLIERPQLDYDHVFLGRSPGQMWKPLSAQGISGVITRYKRQLGLRGACSPHQWRHRWARDMLHRGMELSQVSQLLGHEDVSITVKFYGQFDIDQLQEAYDKYHE